MYAVLLTFENEEAALNLVEQVLDEGVVYKPYGDAGDFQHIDAGEVKAVYKHPTMFCTQDHGGRKTQVGYTMGQKWGWWVCGSCGKPSRLYWENIVEKQSSFGKNLLWTLFEKNPEV